MNPNPVPPNVIDMTGQRFNRLVVLSYGHPYYQKDHLRHKWLCLCDCGNQVLLNRTSLRLNKARSCGCWTKDRLRTHGHSIGGVTSPTYRSWKSMMDRCYLKSSRCYNRYGGAGITVCERWHTFENFLEDMGERPKGKTLDRYPKLKGNYEPGNCRWGTPRQQTLGRSTTVWITVDGITLCRLDWATKVNVSAAALRRKAIKLRSEEAAVRFYMEFGPEKGPNRRSLIKNT